MFHNSKISLIASASIALLSVIPGFTIPASAAKGASVDGADASTDLDRKALKSAMDRVHSVGMPGVYAEVRDGDRVWRGAAGVADVSTGRRVRPDMLHRVGSITKSFTAAAVLQEVEKGRVDLDAPIGRYLPELVPGARGEAITVRMLLNHTSGLPDYLPYAFPSLQIFPAEGSTQSLDDNRFRQWDPVELIEMGVKAPPAGEPGVAPGTYSNTNYLLLGQLLEKVSGVGAEQYITRNVIARAGLRHTGFPTGTQIKGPHSRIYESFFGLIDPPRDYSVYNMSWVSTGAGLVSTVGDMNRFYGMLLGGRIVSRSSLEQMQRTVPVISQTGEVVEYGLGLHRFTVADCGTFWGHDGTVWGAQTLSMTSEDGKRQMSIAMNLVRWNELDASGRPQPHPIDDALLAFQREAVCD
ncbi:serine hydrolase domain-containing protein [Actinoplanes sp. NPDC049548]|uniref:serine hydrolase domain-containing protein n=1 Tax=Actinoplanes sp. NPDC049548 TaxID=3155152 RepID=UPI003438D69F